MLVQSVLLSQKVDSGHRRDLKIIQIQESFEIPTLQNTEFFQTD